MTKKTVPLPPQPLIKRPLAAPKSDHAERPLTNSLMARVQAIIDASEGKHTRASVARDLGKVAQVITEWMAGYRASPNSESTLALVEWCEKNEKRTLKRLEYRIKKIRPESR